MLEQLSEAKNKKEIELKTLDDLLFQVLNHLRQLPYEHRSMVIAGIFDPLSGALYISTANRVENGTAYGAWHHAEQQAMEQARQNGVDLSTAIAITSLSPCVIPSSSRLENSCSELLLSAGITRVHTGHLDERQASKEIYAGFGFDLTVTIDPALKKVCVTLNEYFNPERGNRVVGETKADYIEQALKDLPELV